MDFVSEQKSRMIDMIMEGRRMTEIAKELGIYRSQLYRWLKDEKVIAELEARRVQLRKNAKDKITGRVDFLTSEMLEMAANSTDQRVKFNAIKYLLDRSLGIPTVSKEDDKILDDNNKDKDANALKKELEDIKLKVIK